MRKIESEKEHTTTSDIISRLSEEYTLAAARDHDKISRIDASLNTIRERIDKAYNHICMDLPEINMEIYRTFQQAFDTLDSLSAQGSVGKIENVVESIESGLQNILIRMKHLKKNDMRIFETLELTSRHMEAVQDLLTNLPPEQVLDQGLRSRIRRFSEKKDELIEILRNILDMEDAFAQEVSIRLSQDIRSLEYTLSSAVIILKDLISRSNSMKDPILKIMSGLQTHDIVNQDITTISRGLRKMLDLKNPSDNHDDIMISLLFQERASSLSRDLISQLMIVIRGHGGDLGKEIERIEDMVSHVKEDKDAIGDFLLMNQSGKSTFDIVIAEVMEMFKGIAAKVDYLSGIKETQQLLTNHLSAFYNELEQYITTCASNNLPSGIFDSVLKMISPLKSQARMMRYGNGSAELKENYKDLQKQSEIARQSLDEIKDLLIGSIKGIDTYSGRCLSAISKFRQDIDKLMWTIEGSDNILDDLYSFSLSTTALRKKILADTASNNEELLTGEFKDILYRLENPHSNSLAAGESPDNDEGLTFF